MVRLQHVSKIHGSGESAVCALDDVCLAIAPGEFVSIMGPSGSGKSTLLNLLSALDTPTSGTVELDGRDIATLDDDAVTLFRRRRIGLVFQFFNLLPTLTALENVLLPLLLERHATAADRALATDLLGQMGLSHRMHHKPAQMSGGEMQRTAIARAFVYAPPLILADEPTGNLDSRTGDEVLAMLRDQAERQGNTVIMVTHDAHAAHTGSRLIELRDGRVCSDGALFVTRPPNSVTAPDAADNGGES